jgi:hypothetical protein
MSRGMARKRGYGSNVAESPNDLPSCSMCALAKGISAGEVLGAFHRDAPYLSFWAQHSSGLLSAALAALRRKSRRIADCFLLFAVFYGHGCGYKRLAKNGGVGSATIRELRRSLRNTSP